MLAGRMLCLLGYVEIVVVGRLFFDLFTPNTRQVSQPIPSNPNPIDVFAAK